MRLSHSLIPLAVFAALGSAAAQEQEPPTLNHNPAGCSLDWNGTDGRSYFIQWSTTLTEWSFFPTIRSGSGSPISHGFNCTSPKFFLRLKYTDIPDSGDVNNADFDGDGVPNLAELTSNPQSDPLDQSDTGGDSNGNGLKDNWETYFFGGLGIADPNAILGNDGLTNKDKSDLGLDPNVNYSQSSTPLRSSYTYDLVGRLLTSTGSLTNTTLSYDAEGNILTSN